MINSTEQAKFMKQMAEALMLQVGVDPKKWREDILLQGYQNFVLQNSKHVIQVIETHDQRTSSQKSFKSDQPKQEHKSQ
ncbi:hypothetical protein QJJ72_002884 [Listeria innocua]|nr:hypothetical protein [Listeria innocua]ELD8345828.1 hypothetical protein [Listeria innocua]ELD8348796.1 hypothetical protein [Listeria innocua]